MAQFFGRPNLPFGMAQLQAQLAAQNPIAEGISQIGQAIGGAFAKRGEIKRADAAAKGEAKAEEDAATLKHERALELQRNKMLGDFVNQGMITGMPDAGGQGGAGGIEGLLQGAGMGEPMAPGAGVMAPQPAGLDMNQFMQMLGQQLQGQNFPIVSKPTKPTGQLTEKQKLTEAEKPGKAEAAKAKAAKSVRDKAVSEGQRAMTQVTGDIKTAEKALGVIADEGALRRLADIYSRKQEVASRLEEHQVPGYEKKLGSAWPQDIIAGIDAVKAKDATAEEAYNRLVGKWPDKEADIQRLLGYKPPSKGFFKGLFGG